MDFSIGHVILSIAIVLTAGVSAAAGMDGGAIYVPLFLLCVGLSAKEAVPLSQALIFGGSVVNILMFAGEEHPLVPDLPKIDYRVIMMMNPGLAAGVMLGVLMHLVSPQWLIMLCLLATLLCTFWTTTRKGIKMWNKETELQNSPVPEQSGDANATFMGSIYKKVSNFPQFFKFARSEYKPMVLILACWSAFLVATLNRQHRCSDGYWFQTFAVLLMCWLFTWLGQQQVPQIELHSSVVDQKEGVISWTSTNLRWYLIHLF